MKKILLSLSVLLTVIVVSACGNQTADLSTNNIASSIYQVAPTPRVEVITNNANIRSGLTNSSPILQKAAKNATLDVVNKVDNWYAVRLQDNTIGFIPENQCKTLTPLTTIGNTTVNTTTGIQNPTATPNTTTTPATPNVADNTPPVTDNNTTNEANTAPLSADEQEMVRLVNEARAENNVKPLEVDFKLSNVARVKSQDMINNNYFDHNSPTYGSPFDMMKSFKVNFSQAGENIAGNQTVQAAHTSLMNSPGHRKNILNPNFTHIGVGIKNGGNYGKMFTQMFMSK